MEKRFFTHTEYYGLVAVALFLGFMFSFRSGGTTQPDANLLATTLLRTFVMAFAAIVVHLLAQKGIGYLLGYGVQWKLELPGILLSLLVWLMSSGYLPFPLYGTITLEPIQELRFGKKPGFKFYHLGWIAATGSIANVIFALLLRFAWQFFPLDILSYFAQINILLALVMALPLPFADGIHLFFASRLDYVAYAGALFFFSFLLLVNLSLLWLVLLTGAFAGVLWTGYWLVEKKLT